MYKQIKNTGDNVKLFPSSSLSQINEIISRNGEKNIAIGAIQRLNSTNSVWEGNSAHLFKNKQMIVSDSFVLSPALDQLYMLLENLKSARQSLLGFKNVPDQGIVDICIEDFSTMSRTYISVPSNFVIHLRNYIGKRNDKAPGLCWRLFDKETTFYLNRRKRRRLDKSASCHDFCRISEVQESESDAYISKHTRPRISDIKMLEPEGSIQKDHHASTRVFETSMNFTEEIQKVDSKGSQSCELLSNLVHLHHFHSDRHGVDASEAKIKCMLGSDSSVCKERLQMSFNRDTTPLKSKRSARYMVNITKPRIPDIKMLGPEGSIQKHQQASTCVSETSMNFTDEVQNMDSKCQNCGSLSSLVHHSHSDKCVVDANAAEVKGRLRSDSSVYQEEQQISCNTDTTLLKSKRSARTELSSGNCLMKGKDCYQGVASCSTFDSKVGHPFKTHVPFSLTSLHMMFPKNFNLPSNEQLIKKFSVFGSVDFYRSRVFRYGGSAQVAFIHEADAVAAFKYAKRKALFGKANVRFWLDPYEHKRRGFNPPASKQQGPPLKSCLKNSNSSPLKSCLKNSNSSPLKSSLNNSNSSPLKSCLKNSNSSLLKSCLNNSNSSSLKSCLKNSNSSLSKENRKKHPKVRFTIET